MLEKLIQNIKENQKHGVHCDLWVQRLASSKSFKNNSTAINYLQWKKYASFSTLLDGKIKQQIVVVAEKIVLARLHDPPQDFKQLFEDPLFLVKVRSYNSIFAFTSMGESLAKNSRIDEQMAKAPEDGYTFRA